MEPRNELRLTSSDGTNDTGAASRSVTQASDACQPTYNEAEFKQMVRRGTAAWTDVPDATDWVEDLRGGDA